MRAVSTARSSSPYRPRHHATSSRIPAGGGASRPFRSAHSPTIDRTTSHSGGLRRRPLSSSDTDEGLLPSALAISP
ncbi:hypothetical protein Sipo8835_27910 [Streptomyces ipomoeae]|uniref:Uncharacterized protein n=1 Tax=Streptomyces ipomoeae TaxID=103232 RepID=A0AAE8VZ65_9ACTN|nr:hypothetical protein [Streptomyces ipomoeae]MDX2697168.1 hypothetical protein [Streptomyces ipomoeae]MDX2824645.1 hypothetical protein [Streptomyces ipomoeae]MDX2842124.1 hypothetical protein [Streptomyces ipomoeae]MDX2877317.1 hypothetical protein [Streptomyces ipomoeae]MDX2937496.1 hypothetical protein [Streptomyces ipomoeae]